METRFRVILANGAETHYTDVAELVAAFRAGQFAPTSLLFDERGGRWTPAIEHDAIIGSTVHDVPSALPTPPRPEPVAPGAPPELQAPRLEEMVPLGSPETDPRLDPSLAKIRGVGGWLALFEGLCLANAFLLTVSALSNWTESATENFQSLTQLAPSAGLDRTLETAGGITLAAGCLSLFLYLALRRSSAALLAVTVLVALLGYALVEAVLTTAVFGELHRALGRALPVGLQQAEQERYGQIGRGILVSALWLLYFFKSRRVRATFGPVTWARLKVALVGRLPPPPAAAGAR